MRCIKHILPSPPRRGAGGEVHTEKAGTEELPSPPRRGAGGEVLPEGVYFVVISSDSGILNSEF
jgi:hypothetical protein